MYCPSCGAQLMQALSYCNRCGANLEVSRTGEETIPQPSNNDAMLWGVIGTNITILGMILGALVLMNNGAINNKLGTAFVIVSIVSLLLIDGLIVWRALSLTGIAHKSGLAPHSREFNETPRTAPVLELSQPGETVPTTTEQANLNPEPSSRGERR